MGKKIVVYLEKYVEWVALGLAGLWLVYMLFTYVLGTPVTVAIGPATATPGNVDRLISDTSVTALDGLMQPGSIPPMIVKPFAEQFARAIDFNGSVVPDIPVPPLLAGIAPSTVPEGPDERNLPQIPKAKELPTPPPVIFDAVSSGRSVVILPPDANAAAPAAGPPGTSSDRDWVSVSFTLPARDLQAAFTKATIPPVLGTWFLSAELIRQEKINGNWGPETAIKRLAINALPPLPVKGPFDDQASYEDWAVKEAAFILQPPFFEVRPQVGGDAWRVPGSPDPAAIAPVAPNPEEMRPAELRPAERAPRQPRNPPNPQRPRGRPGRDEMPPDTFRQVIDRNRPTFPGRPSVPPGVMFEEGMNPEGFGGGFQPAAAIPGLPQNIFNPQELVNDLLIWAHDDSIESERTYRYKLRYTIRNPMFGQPQFAIDPKLADTWAITSADSDWSTEVTVPARAYFFLAGGGVGSPTARFKIFRWQDGVWKSTTEAVAPGDIIGKTVGGVDYGTGWTVVDIRRDPARSQQSYTLLVNDRGELVRRYTDTDNADPKQKELNDLAQAANANAAAAGPLPFNAPGR